MPKAAHWWRRGPVVAAVMALILLTELLVGWRALADALHQLRTPQWNWVAGALVAEIASMGSYARMQQALMREPGRRCRSASTWRWRTPPTR